MMDLIVEILAQKQFYINKLNYVYSSKNLMAVAQIAFSPEKSRIYLDLNTAFFYLENGEADITYNLHNPEETKDLISLLNRMMDFYNQHPPTVGTGQSTGADFEYPIIL